MKWVCNCGHPADAHETAVVAASSAYANFSNADLAREWVCGGVRQEIRNEVGCSSWRSTRRIANRGNCAKAHFFALVIATIVRPRYTAADGVWWWW